MYVLPGKVRMHGPEAAVKMRQELHYAGPIIGIMNYWLRYTTSSVVLRATYPIECDRCYDSE